MEGGVPPPPHWPLVNHVHPLLIVFAINCRPSIPINNVTFKKQYNVEKGVWGVPPHYLTAVNRR